MMMMIVLLLGRICFHNPTAGDRRYGSVSQSIQGNQQQSEININNVPPDSPTTNRPHRHGPLPSARCVDPKAACKPTTIQPSVRAGRQNKKFMPSVNQKKNYKKNNSPINQVDIGI